MNHFIEFILLVIGSYLLGSIPSSYLAAKIYRGIDLRKYGTGNVGIGNLFEMVGKKLMIPVIIFDFGKGMAVVFIARALGLDVVQQVAAGLAVVIGHNWPIFLHFTGGRGILTTLGIIIAIMPMGIFAFGAIALFTLKSRTTPLPVLGGVAVQPLMSWLMGDPPVITFGFPIGNPPAVTFGLLGLLIIMLIRRLTASRPAVSISRRELLLNRLLFDRDIKNREEWIFRLPEEANLTEEEWQRLQKRKIKKACSE